MPSSHLFLFRVEGNMEFGVRDQQATMRQSTRYLFRSLTGTDFTIDRSQMTITIMQPPVQTEDRIPTLPVDCRYYESGFSSDVPRHFPPQSSKYIISAIR
jgi:hypothetical protein